MKKLKGILLVLAALGAAMMVLLKVLKGRYLSQQITDGQINAVAVTGDADENITLADFRGGYLRAVMGGVKLDLSESTVVNPPTAASHSARSKYSTTPP